MNLLIKTDWIAKIDELSIDEEVVQELFGLRKRQIQKQDPNIIYIEAKIPRKDALNKFVKLFESLIKSSKYKEISKSISIQDSFDNDKENFINNSENKILVFEWDLWSYNKNARTDQELNEVFDELVYSLIEECDKEMDKYGYIIDIDADWDTGSVYLATDCNVDKIRRKVVE